LLPAKSLCNATGLPATLRAFCHALAALGRFSRRREAGRSSEPAGEPRRSGFIRRMGVYKWLIGPAGDLFSASEQLVSGLDSGEVACSRKPLRVSQLSTFSVDNDVYSLYKAVLSSNRQMPFAPTLKSYAEEK
jgi:hypothetical protein